MDEEWSNPSDDEVARATKFIYGLGLVFIAVGVAAFVVLLKITNGYEQAGEQVPRWVFPEWGLCTAGAGVLLILLNWCAPLLMRRYERQGRG